jgi:hypothetical protein
MISAPARALIRSVFTDICAARFPLLSHGIRKRSQAGMTILFSSGVVLAEFKMVVNINNKKYLACPANGFSLLNSCGLTRLTHWQKVRNNDNDV